MRQYTEMTGKYQIQYEQIKSELAEARAVMG